MQNFRNLKIWELAKELTVEIYKISGDFPTEEKYGMTNQLRRASNSICANIAEGSGRNTNKDFANFINIAIGSIVEVESFIEICLELNYINEQTYEDLIAKIEELRRRTIKFNQVLRK